MPLASAFVYTSVILVNTGSTPHFLNGILDSGKKFMSFDKIS